MPIKFIVSVTAIVAALNIIAWAFSAPRAKTYPTALDFGAGIIRISNVPALSLPAAGAGAFEER